jgi:ArsR family transcriptional regulator, arsenate/arsenite/antimonite-responsive transcriptional repressor / arsenate reductase (thioredoxin)
VNLKVLFLCATNGVQSAMAEALLNSADSKHFEVTSAGIDRGEIHALTAEVMKEIGLDLSGKGTKSVRDVLGFRFDLVITLCDRSRSGCPPFPGAEIIHWQFPNPLVVADPTKQKRMFQSLRDQISQRIRLFALVQARFVAVDRKTPPAPRSRPTLFHS